MRNKGVLFEVAVVFALLILPVFISGIIAEPRTPGWPFNLLSPSGWLSSLVYSASRVLLLAFLIWNSGDQPSRFGFGRIRWKLDVPIAAGAFIVWQAINIALFAAKGGDAQRYFALGYHFATLPVANPLQGAVLFVPVLAAILSSAFYEETLYRGYLVIRLKELFRNAPAAILVSGIFFGAAHMHQGPVSVLARMVQGWIFGIVFAKTGRLWPLFVAHAALNTWITFG